MKITQQLIADASGLSVATVSRALAGHPGIPVETRRKVEQVARRLGYKGPKARTRARHVATIGVLVAANAGPVAHEVLSGITEVAGVDGMGVSIHMVAGTGSDVLREQIGNWALLSAGGLCGVIAVGDWPEMVLPDMLGTLPNVVIGKGEGAERLVPDLSAATLMLYEWLRDQGHRSIGCVMACELSLSQATISSALRFSETTYGLGGADDNRVDDIAGIRRRTMTGVTAWICENESVAQRVRLLLAESKLQAPRDVSLAVVDDGPSVGAAFAGVKPSWHAIGALSMVRLQGRMSSSVAIPPAVTLYGGELVTGAAAGIAPGSGQ